MTPYEIVRWCVTGMAALASFGFAFGLWKVGIDRESLPIAAKVLAVAVTATLVAVGMWWRA